MLRKIIQIDEDKCTGCGICVDACHEGAIGLVNGKAKLMRDDYCDGLGDCLPTCPTGAISFIEKDTLAYDEEAVKKNMEKRMKESGTMHSGCPGSMMHTLNPVVSSPSINVTSQLTSWPVQIKLAPINAPFFQHAKLLIAADCTAYAYANFHQEFGIKIIYAFLTIFLYLLKCPQSLILSALRAFCFCGKPHISRSIFLYFRYQAWLKSW